MHIVEDFQATPLQPLLRIFLYTNYNISWRLVGSDYIAWRVLPPSDKLRRPSGYLPSPYYNIRGDGALGEAFYLNPLVLELYAFNGFCDNKGCYDNSCRKEHS